MCRHTHILACLMHETGHVHAILACTGEPLNTHDTQEMSQAYTWFTTVHVMWCSYRYSRCRH